MNINKKVPSNSSSIGTSNLFMIPLKNKNAISLYTKKALISSLVLKYCISYRIHRSSPWPEAE